jgi:hypothetical protein
MNNLEAEICKQTICPKCPYYTIQINPLRSRLLSDGEQIPMCKEIRKRWDEGGVVINIKSKQLSKWDHTIQKTSNCYRWDPKFKEDWLDEVLVRDALELNLSKIQTSLNTTIAARKQFLREKRALLRLAQEYYTVTHKFEKRKEIKNLRGIKDTQKLINTLLEDLK